MKQIIVSGYTFLFDDEDYEFFKDKNLRVHVSRNKPFLILPDLDFKKVTPVSKIILNSEGRTGYIDKNTLNLQKSNIYDLSAMGEIELLKKKKYIKDSWNKKNQDKINKLGRENYHKNKDKIRSRQKEYSKLPKYRENNRLKHYTINGKYNNLKSCSAKRKKQGREIGLSITLEEYAELMKNNCHYCNKTLIDEKSGGSLDRIDNSKGYHLDNVLPCCKVCNQVRGDNLTVEETEVVIKALLEFRDYCHKGSMEGLVVREKK